MDMPAYSFQEPNSIFPADFYVICRLKIPSYPFINLVFAGRVDFPSYPFIREVRVHVIMFPNPGMQAVVHAVGMICPPPHGWNRVYYNLKFCPSTNSITAHH